MSRVSPPTRWQGALYGIVGVFSAWAAITAFVNSGSQHSALFLIVATIAFIECINLARISVDPIGRAGWVFLAVSLGLCWADRVEFPVRAASLANGFFSAVASGLFFAAAVRQRRRPAGGRDTWTRD